MNKSLLALACAIALGGAFACDKNANAPTSPADVPAKTAPAGDAIAPAAPTMMGAVTEEQFAALHQLADNKPSPLYGKDVVIGGARGYLSVPPGLAAPMPAVLIVHEWWGLNDNIRHYADRLASIGVAALAVDLYGGNIATTPEQASAYMKSVDPQVAIKILKAGADYLKDEPAIKATKRGAIGFCFGGGWALQTALAVQDLDADVVYYGFVPTDEKELSPLKAPLLAFFGTQDQSIPKSQVDAFESTLKKLGKDVRIERYDAGHAFANPSGPNYSSALSQKAWDETRAFFVDKLAIKAEAK